MIGCRPEIEHSNCPQHSYGPTSIHSHRLIAGATSGGGGNPLPIWTLPSDMHFPVIRLLLTGALLLLPTSICDLGNKNICSV